MRKSILSEILSLLDYLQKNDSKPKARKVESLKTKKSERVLSLCEEAGYIKEGEENKEYYSKKVNPRNTKKEIFIGEYIRITIKGIEFLERHREIKSKKELLKSQTFFTFALFSIGMFQGILLLIYYVFDLKSKNLNEGAQILWISGMATLTFLFFSFKSMKKILSLN